MNNKIAHMLSVWGLAILSCLAFNSVRAQTVPIPFPNLRFSQSAELRSVERLPNGKYIIAGNFLAVNDIKRSNIARLNADGTVDLTWVPRVNGSVRRIVVENGDVYAIGAFDSSKGVARRGLVRIPLSGDGSPDLTWDPMGSTMSADGSGAVLVVDGNLLASFLPAPGSGGARQVGVFSLVDGSLSQSITFPNDFYPHVIARDGDHVYIGGRDNGATPPPPRVLFRYSISTGYSQDMLWVIELGAEQGRPQVRDLAFDANHVYLGGYFNGNVQGVRNNLCRFSKASVLLDPWSPGVLSPPGTGQPTNQNTAPINSLALVDGILHAGGRFDAVLIPGAGPTPPGIIANHAAFSTNQSGDLDSDRTASADATIWDLSPSASNIVAAGEFSSWSGNTALSIARFFVTNGVQDPSFLSYVQGAPGQVNAFARQPDGKLILGGLFRAVGSVSRHNLARLNADGSLDNTWAPEITASPNTNLQPLISSLAIDGTHLYLGGRFDLVNGIARSSLARMSYVDGAHLDLNWNPVVENVNPYHPRPPGLHQPAPEKAIS